MHMDELVEGEGPVETGWAMALMNCTEYNKVM